MVKRIEYDVSCEGLIGHGSGVFLLEYKRKATSRGKTKVLVGEVFNY